MHFMDKMTKGALKGPEKTDKTSFTGVMLCIVLIALVSVWCLNASLTDNIKVIVLNLALCFLVIMGIFFMMLKLLDKYAANEMKSRDLNERMAAAAQIYYEFKEVDIINNTIRPVIAREDEALKTDGENAQQIFLDYVNEEVEEHFKLQMKEFVDFSILGLLLEYRVSATTTFMTKQGKWLRARVVRCQHTPAGKVATFLWILEDISEERQQRDALIDVSNRVAAANNAKTAFLSTISNELRAPIDAVLGINSMILEESREPQTIRYSESIRDASVDLLGMINDILDFSIIEAGKMEIAPREYDFRELLNELVTVIKPQTEAKKLSFVLDIDANMPKILYGDDVHIKQIFMNLLTNAVKYTTKGRVILSVHAEKMGEEHIGLHVSVKDTGQGIKEEDKSRLFVEFERIEEGRGPTVGGTGLGVTITQRLLGLMDSTLEVESVYKLGSNFYFALEQQVVDWTPIGNIGDVVIPTIEEGEEHLPDFIYNLAEVNVEAGIKNNGDEESYLEALKVYASSVNKYIEEITEYLKADDLENATIKIHALKSTSRIIGAESIGELALALENAGKAGDKEKVENEVGGLLERCRRLGQQLRPLLAASTSGEEAVSTDKPSIKEEKLAETYEKLRECAAAFDSFGIEEVLEGLHNYQLSEDQQEKITALAQAIDNFDFEKVSEILKEE
ncbi:Hpt domain-containing protein [Anaerovibrio sp. RM50]|uniref:Hpt domain-containing protein n=1 Tax=Anaerovibrio sp. RM50 TaxID=1200557 RepID=UPI000481484E|nr:Hpt domain-containing protein [Anaerovibrio sp. RM50]